MVSIGVSYCLSSQSRTCIIEIVSSWVNLQGVWPGLEHLSNRLNPHKGIAFGLVVPDSSNILEIHITLHGSVAIHCSPADIPDCTHIG